MLVEPRLTYLVLVRCFLNAIVTVLVYSGYYNKIPYTGCLLNNRNLFLAVSKAGKSKIKVAADPLSDKVPSFGSETTSIHCGRGKGAFLGSFYKDTSPIPEGSTHMT